MNRFAVRLAFTLLCGIAPFPLFAITRTWTGAVNGNWSVAANWSPSGAPDSTDTLIFPFLMGKQTQMFNDLPTGTAFGAMRFECPYTLSGNPLLLTGDVSLSTFNVDLKLGASVAFSGISNGSMDINGYMLTSGNATFNGPINGNGTIISTTFQGITVNGGNFSGTIRGGPSGGGLSLGEACSLPSATISIEMILQRSLSATLGDVTITPSAFGFVSPGPSGGVLHTKSLTLSAATPPAWGGSLWPLIDSTGGDQIDVTGTVTLNGAKLGTLPFGNPAIGQSFTIINNDGTDPVIGTFAELPEGAVFNGLHRYRVSYVGGDGNDVVLTTLADNTNTALSQNANTTQFGEPFTATATVTAQSGTPTGSAVFTADGATIGTSSLQDGVAHLAITMLSPGTHELVARFKGTSTFVDSVSAGVTHVVIQGQTKTEIVANHPGITCGQAVRFTAAVSAQSPASGQPDGNVTVLAGGVPLGTAPLVNGTAIFETSALHAGAMSITAAYGGDPNFAASTASAIQQSVSKAQTEVDARMNTPFLGGQSPLITVYVRVTPGSLVPTGVVTISEGSAILGTQVLADGAARFVLKPLALGDHTLVVDYSGGDDFDASSETIVQSVAPPVVSIQGVRVLEVNRGETRISLVASLSAPISETVRVSFSTVAGSATEGEDYEKASGVVEFAPGEVTRAIEFHIVGDLIPEGTETFSLVLFDPVNATIETLSIPIVIVDDDQVPPRHRPSRP